MRALHEEPTETLHVFVVPEEQLPKKPDHPSILAATLALLCIVALIGIALFSKTSGNDVSFTVSVPMIHLAPITKSLKTMVMVTGKGRTQATTASGIITFYNGAIYTQIIPVGTILQGTDGVSVITTQQAIIPPAAQTIPPTYGHTNVWAHAIMAGASGNIQAGDINEACCVTSVIAQNPFNFTGGRNARDFTYLTASDVTHTSAHLVPTLQASTLSHLPAPQLNPHCFTTTTASPHVGKETQTATITVVATCSAATYSIPLIIHTGMTYARRFGTGTLAHLQFVVVDVRKGAVVVYISGVWLPLEVRTRWTGK